MGESRRKTLDATAGASVFSTVAVASLSVLFAVLVWREAAEAQTVPELDIRYAPYYAEGDTNNTTGTVIEEDSFNKKVHVADVSRWKALDGILIERAGAPEDSNFRHHVTRVRLVEPDATGTGGTLTLEVPAPHKPAGTVNVLPDDTLAFREALDNTPDGLTGDDGPRTVVVPTLPTGSMGWNLGGDVRFLDNDVTLKGDNTANTRIRRTGSFQPGLERRYFLHVSRSAQLGLANFTFQGVYLDGNEQEYGDENDQNNRDFAINVTANTLDPLNYARNVKVIDSTFVEQPGVCAGVRNADGFRFQNIHCLNPRKGGLTANLGSRNGDIVGNTVTNTGDDAIAINASGGGGNDGQAGAQPKDIWSANPLNIKIWGNTASVEENARGGTPIIVRGGDEITVGDTNPGDADLLDHNTTTGGRKAGIAVVHSPDQEHFYVPTNVTVVGNKVKDTGAYRPIGPDGDPDPAAPGVLVQSRDARSVHVLGNDVLRPASDGIVVENNGAMDDIRVNSNEVTSAGYDQSAQPVWGKSGVGRGLVVREARLPGDADPNTAGSQDWPEPGEIVVLNAVKNSMSKCSYQCVLVAANTDVGTLRFLGNRLADANQANADFMDALMVRAKAGQPANLLIDRYAADGTPSVFVDDAGGPKARSGIRVLNAGAGRVENNTALQCHFSDAPVVVVPQTVAVANNNTGPC